MLIIIGTPTAALSRVCIVPFLFPPIPYGLPVTVPTPQMRKLRQREVKELPRGHTESGWKCQESEPRLLAV